MTISGGGQSSFVSGPATRQRSAAPLERGLEEMMISPRGAGGHQAKVLERQRTAELAAVESRSTMAASGRRTRQRPADILSPRRSFCDFVDLDLAPKKTRSGEHSGLVGGNVGGAIGGSGPNP